jgi:DNA helicase-2/ATP-dependent DNA helicase PcrA
MHVSTDPRPEDRWLDGMNAEQRAIITHEGGPAVVLAGAGSGKTATLARRVAWLVERGVSPARIALVTFGVRAAKEIGERIERLGVPGVEAFTWHGLAFHVLRQDRVECAAWTVDERDEHRGLVKLAMGFRHENWPEGDLGEVCRFIAVCKAHLAGPGSKRAAVLAGERFGAEAARALAVYAVTERLVEEKKLLTFDDMLVRAHEHLSNEENRRRWGARWRHLLQDECADANLAQVKLAEQLARDHRNYMVVGDPSQCHPPGVQVQTPDGVRPIEELGNDDGVMAWDQAIKGLVKRPVEIARRRYRGAMLTVHVAGRQVPLTPNHRFTVRWSRAVPEAWVTCVMWRADFGFRLDAARVFGDPGTRPRVILQHAVRAQRAEKFWVLDVLPTQDAARAALETAAARFGIPTAPFEPGAGYTAEAIAAAFAAAAATHHQRGVECLASRGRAFDLPLLPLGEGAEPGRAVRDWRAAFPVHAINLLPELMTVPISGPSEVWAAVERVEQGVFDGHVYSLEVETNHAYVANGIVVLNSIYGFRGSSPEYLTDFAEQWGAKVYCLHRKYRSGRAVVAAANEVLRPAAVKLPVDLVAERPLDGVVRVVRAASPEDEAEELGAHVAEHAAGGGRYADVAVLFRTNAQSRAVEEALLARKIPYRVLGGVVFYERKEVKDLLAYLRVAAGRDESGDALRRCINAPFRYLGAKFYEKVREAKARSWVDRVRLAGHVEGLQARQKRSALGWADLIEELGRGIQRGARPSALLEEVLAATGFAEWVERDQGKQSVEGSPAANVRELVRLAERFPIAGELLDFVDETVRAARRAKDDDEKPDQVLLMSVHRAKGLEWPRVWVIGCNEELMPHAKGEPEEERRIFYVATTRARDELVLSHVAELPMRRGRGRGVPSRFLREAGIDDEEETEECAALGGEERA